MVRRCRALGLPEHLEVVAYLCVGYVDDFADEPELARPAGPSAARCRGSSTRRPRPARLPGEEPHDLLARRSPTSARSTREAAGARAPTDRMTKPPGALGVLEIVGVQLSGLAGSCPPPIPEPAAVAIFAGDHGVHAQGVTPWPQEVTAQMVANFLAGGAVVNAFAAQVGAEVVVVDVGVAARPRPPRPACCRARSAAAPRDMTTGPGDDPRRGRARRSRSASRPPATWSRPATGCLLTGDMGIANTTASAALIAAFTGADPAEVTGRGTGIDDETHARKIEVVAAALDLHRPDPADPIGVLAAVGGLEHAAIVGFLLGAASLRTPGASSTASSPARRRWWRRAAPRRVSRLDRGAPLGRTGPRPGPRAPGPAPAGRPGPAARRGHRRAARAAAGAERGPRDARGRDVRLGRGDREGPDRATATHREPDRAARPRVPGRPAPARPAGRRGRRRAVAQRRVAGLLEAGAGHARRQPDAHPRRSRPSRTPARSPGTPGRYAPRRPRRRLVRGRGHRRRRRSTPRSPPRPSAARLLRARRRPPTPAPPWTPAVGRLRRLTVAVHGGGDPRRAAGVRDAVPSRACATARSPTAATASRDPAASPSSAAARATRT